MPPQRRHPGRLDRGRAPPPPRTDRLADWDDDDLLELSRRHGDAFAVLVERHHQRLRRYLARRVAPDQIDDALAELWEAGFRRRHTYDPTRGSATGWLYGIAKNVTHHARRRTVRGRDLEGRLQASGRPVPVDDPAERLVADESVDQIVSALALLPDHERSVVELVVAEGASYELASRQLGVPIGTVRSRLARARSRLRTVAALDW